MPHKPERRKAREQPKVKATIALQPRTSLKPSRLGRPSSYTRELGREICELVASRVSICEIVRDGRHAERADHI